MISESELLTYSDMIIGIISDKPVSNRKSFYIKITLNFNELYMVHDDTQI